MQNSIFRKTIAALSCALLLIVSNTYADHGGTSHINLNLQAPATSETGSYFVSWDNLNYIQMLEEMVDGGEYTQTYLPTNGPDERFVFFSNKDPGTYSYRVKVQLCFMECDWYYTLPVTVVVSGAEPIPGVPSAIQGPSGDTDGLFNLSWGSVATASSYSLERRVQGGSWFEIQDTADNTRAESGLAANTWEYRVAACNGSGCSAWTDTKTVVVATPTIETPPAPTMATDPGPSTASDQIGATAGNFRVNEAGAAVYSIAIEAAAGTAGVSPTVSLNYSSNGGNGIAGIGWSLGGLSSIARCRQTYEQDRNPSALTFTNEDRLCLDGQRLVPHPTGQTYWAPNTTYRTEVDSGAIVTIRGNASGEPDYLEVQRKDGSTSFYGKAPGNSDTSSKYGQVAGKTLIWAIRKFEDNVGNPIWFTYDDGGTGHRINRIEWAYGHGQGPGGASAKLSFRYADRLDKSINYVAGTAFRVSKRLTHIDSYNNTGSGMQLLRTLVLRYNEGINSNDKTSRLTSVQECSGSTCLPKTTFSWREPVNYYASTQIDSLNMGNNLIDFMPADINGDGIMDWVWKKGSTDRKIQYAIGTSSGLVTQTFTNGSNVLIVNSGGKAPPMQAIDYNMDGRQDILYYDTNVEVWKLLLAVPINGGGWKLSANTIETPLRFATHKDADIVFLDIDSNGTSDAIYREPQQDTIRVRRLSVDETLPESSSTRYRFEDPIAPIGYYGADMIGDGVGVAPDFNGDGQVDLVIAGNDFDCEGSYWSCAAVEDNRQLVVADGFAGGQPGVEILASLPEAAWMPLMQTPDFNGDGLSDAFYPMHFTKSDGKSQYYRVDINNGNGSFTMKQAFLDDSMNKEKALPAVADWNMDGFPDVLWNDHSGSGTIYGRLWNPSTESFDNPIVISTASTGSKKERVLFVDANGDAALDIIIAGYNGNLGDVRVFSRKWGSTYGNVAVNRIETIGNGLGAETSVTYEPISYSDHYERLEIGSTSGTVTQCDYEPGFGETCIPVTVTVPDKDSFYSEINGGWDVPNGAQVIPKSAPVLELGSSMYVVTDVREDAPSAGVAPGSVNNDTSNSISYEYREAKLQAAGRGFLGFKQLTTIDNKSGVRTTTSYRQDWPFTGIPLGTRTETASGHLLANNYSSWEVAEWNASFAETVLNNGSAAVGSIHLFEASALSDAYALENGGSAQGAHLTSASMTMTPDAEGNPSVTTTTSKNQVSGVVELTSVMTTDYDSAFPLWQGRVSRTEAVNTRHGHAPVTRLATFTYRADGLLGSETTYDEDLATVHMRTVHGYDAFGNVVRTATTGDGVTRCDVDTSVYDAGTGRYVDRQYDCLGRLTSVVVDRNKFGQPTAVDAVIDATNTNARVQTRFGYGALGREYFRATEDGSFTTAYLTTDSNNCPSGTAYKSTTTSAGGGQAQACFDVMGRQTRSLTVAMDGRWIATDVEYDALGRSKHESEPYYLGDARYWTTVDYDLLGRTTQMKRPDGALSSIAYNNFDTVETNALSQSRTVKRNGLGETVRTIDDMNGTVDFTYDKYGTLAQTIVNQGQTTTPIVVASYYDYHGNKWKVDDPDKGTWTFKYNAFGELTERKNAICNGSNPSWCQTTVMSYDSVGRLRTRKDFDENQNPNSVTSYEANSEWVYDTAENGLGKLNYVTDSQTGYTQYFDYDQYGRSSIVYTSIDDGSYSEQTTYDQYGRLFQYFDAGGDGSFTDAGVLHVYNSYGYMVATGDAMSVGGAPSTMYKRLVETDARGQPTRVELGVSSDGSAAMTATFGYEPETGLPDWQRVNGYQGALLQHYSYTWDDIGNLKSRTDHRGSAKTDTYIYDQLNRMKRQTTSGQPTQYFDYDINGNLKTRTGVSGTYVYGQYGAGPHAATRVNGTSYWYDANGNNVAGGGRSIDYYTFQKPRSISKGGHATEFDYTPDKVRYRRIDTGSGETITRYIGNVEVISRTTGPNETRRYIDGVAIEISNSASGERETVYVLKDHLGSSDQLVDAFGVPVNTTMSFGAWGQRRNGDSWKELDANQKLIDMGPDFDVHDASIKTTMGYTSHETLDATQVIHMNGRIYDPFIGRFLQADPFVPAPTDSQSHNRYSYVRNNPLSATDPSGFFDMKSFYKKMMQADGRWKTQKYIHNHAQWLDTAVPIALSFIPVWGAAAAAGYSYDSAFYLTGSLNEATRAGAISYVSAEAFSAVGNSNMGFWSKVASNAVIGGVTSELRGGKFGHGFFAAGVATAVPVESMYGNGSYYRPARVITKAVIGGTISEMTGGKFSNGAITAAFAYSLGGIGRQTYAKVSEEDRSYMKMTYATMDATKGDEGFLTRDGFVLDQLIQEESGLKAGLWTGPDGEKVLAYSGANGADFKDWWTSIKQAHGMETKQYKEAIALAENLGSGVHYTGTSLGGGLASVSAMAVGGRATVFNTAGLHSNTLQGLDPGSASIRHLYSTGDILRVLNALTPAKVYGQSYSLGYAGMHGRNGLCAQLCN